VPELIDTHGQPAVRTLPPLVRCPTRLRTGPASFPAVCIAEVAEVLAEHGFKGHSYADDTQTYISVPDADAVDAALHLSVYIVSIDSWMTRMSSQPLEDEPRQDSATLDRNAARPQLSKVAVNEVALSTGPLGFSTVLSLSMLKMQSDRRRAASTASAAGTLMYIVGVLFDEQLSMADHGTAVCKSCFFQLRQLRPIRSCLTMDSAKTLVHAFISSRLDYCNSLLVGAADCVIRKQQRVQNVVVARLITGTRKFDHITSHQSCGTCTGCGQ